MTFGDASLKVLFVYPREYQPFFLLYKLDSINAIILDKLTITLHVRQYININDPVKLRNAACGVPKKGQTKN